MQANKGKKADGYQSPFNNRFYVRIREEQLKEAKYTINYEVESIVMLIIDMLAIKK